MLPYCLKCRKNTESTKPKVIKTKNGRIMFTSNRAVCSSKKSRFVKEQEAKRLSNVIPLLGPLLILLKIALMHLKIKIYNIKQVLMKYK